MSTPKTRSWCRLAPAFLLLVGWVTPCAAEHPTHLTFDERVEAQRAIEEVYWRHRIWPKENPAPKPPLSDVLSEEALRARVDDILAKSVALDEFWGRPITDEQLQAEMERMARDTRRPNLLRELFAALGHDPLLVAECLARPLLVDRLIHGWYSRDPRLHRKLRATAEEELSHFGTAEHMELLGGDYHETAFVLDPEGSWEDATPSNTSPAVELRLDRRDWRDLLVRLAGDLRVEADWGQLPVGRLSRLVAQDDRFLVRVVLERTAGSVRIATVTWEKEPFNDWWREARTAWNPAVLRRENAGAGARTPSMDSPVHVPLVEGSACTPDTWSPTAWPIEERKYHTAVWTGTEMIIWGGRLMSALYLDSGWRYDPASDTWHAISIGANLPEGRSSHTAVWTGTEMIVWGGLGNSTSLNSGGRYDPSTDTWAPTSMGPDVPAPRNNHTAVWTGTELVVWGGVDDRTYPDTGGRYDPSTDSWTAVSTVGAPAARSSHTAVWTGSEMIAWGGHDYISHSMNTGGRYDPSSNTWTSTSMGIDVPEPRSDHTAVWTGTEMIVWGGAGSLLVNTGGRYDPAEDMWTPTSAGADPPSVRHGHTAVWTGDEMIIWGGRDGGWRYDPAADVWRPISNNLPAASHGHTAIWSGSEMIVWGGEMGSITRLGGRYDPITDTWKRTSLGPETPEERRYHTAVWTGAEMIVWGGYGTDHALRKGGRYDPATDSWTPTSVGVNSPPGMFFHTAVWTGTEMIVWGGSPIGGRGGRYNPLADTWSPTSTGAANPDPRQAHVAVWTGTEMIIWGGSGFSGPENTGGRYDPSSDTWTPTSTGAGVPAGRGWTAAVWTGSEMIVWGGNLGYPYTGLNTGGRYDPCTDTWEPTSTDGSVPDGRMNHSAVWTGTEMIVWGGWNAFTLDTGGRYDPWTDAWTPTSTGPGLPTPRSSHTALWIGTEMIVWGGSSHELWGVAGTGGRYDPLTDRWTSTPVVGAPASRDLHTAVWSGTEMIIWGGRARTLESSTGGRYCPGSPASVDDTDRLDPVRGPDPFPVVDTMDITTAGARFETCDFSCSGGPEVCCGEGATAAGDPALIFTMNLIGAESEPRLRDAEYEVYIDFGEEGLRDFRQEPGLISKDPKKGTADVTLKLDLKEKKKKKKGSEKGGSPFKGLKGIERLSRFDQTAATIDFVIPVSELQARADEEQAAASGLDREPLEAVDLLLWSGTKQKLEDGVTAGIELNDRAPNTNDNRAPTVVAEALLVTTDRAVIDGPVIESIRLTPIAPNPPIGAAPLLVWFTVFVVDTLGAPVEGEALEVAITGDPRARLADPWSPLVTNQDGQAWFVVENIIRDGAQVTVRAQRVLSNTVTTGIMSP